MHECELRQRQAARFGHRVRARPVLVDGALGLQIETTRPDGRMQRLVASFAVDGGRITGIFNQLNPNKLTRVAEIGAGDGWPQGW